jgi:hypothetical protein
MYTLAALLDDCAESPKHSKAAGDTFKTVWGGLMAWMSSNWMVGKGVHLAPLGKFVFFTEELDLGTRKKLTSKVPSFIANEEYLRTYGIKYRATAQKKEEGVAMEMNYSNIAQFAATSKDMVQLALKDIFLHLGRTAGSGRKVNIDFYIGRITAEHGILSFNFFDTEALQRREAERARGMHILATAPPDGPSQVKGGMASGRSTARSRRTPSVRSNYSFGMAPPKSEVELNLDVSAPPSVYSRSEANGNYDQVAAANKRDAGNRSVYDADVYSVRSGRSGSVRSAPIPLAQTGRSQYSFVSGDEADDEDPNGYTNSLGLIGSKAKPDPGQPYLVASGSPTKAHVIHNAYERYEQDIYRRQEAADKLDKDAQDRQRLQQQVEILKAEQKRREQQEMKRMLAKQVVERQKKREEERREKLVPYDLTHVLPLERDRDFFQEYAEKQGMKRALFKQMEEKKNIKQRELDRERAMDMESKEALASSLAKEHALNTYTRMNAGSMLRDNWAKQIRLHNVQRRIEGDHFAPEPVGKRG